MGLVQQHNSRMDHCSPLHVIPRKLQSGYRRHLVNSKRLFQLKPARWSLDQRSRLGVHVVQEFYIGLIQPRKNVFETNIVVIDDHIPQIISLAHASLLRAHRHILSRIISSPKARAFAMKKQTKSEEEESSFLFFFLFRLSWRKDVFQPKSKFFSLLSKHLKKKEKRQKRNGLQ